MKIFLVLVHFILSLNAFSYVELDLFFKTQKVNLGEIVEAEVRLKGASEKEIQDLIVGNNLLETFHVISYEKEHLKGVFFQLPPREGLSKKGSYDIFVRFINIQVNSIQAENKYLFENFEIEQNSEINKIMVVIVLFFLGLISFFSVYFYKKHLEKKLIRSKREVLKNEILSRNKLEEIIDLWQKRNIYFQEFPHIVDPFKKFEQILFKYQFKPQISEIERIEILEAYKRFLKIIEGGFHGI